MVVIASWPDPSCALLLFCEIGLYNKRNVCYADVFNTRGRAAAAQRPNPPRSHPTELRPRVDEETRRISLWIKFLTRF